MLQKGATRKDFFIMPDYQKMYAALVGQVDQVLTAMEKMQGTRGELLWVQMALTRALEEGEETFIREAGEEDLADDGAWDTEE